MTSDDDLFGIIRTRLFTAVLGDEKARQVFALARERLAGDGAGLTATPFVGMAAKPDGTGYWLVTSTGAIYSFGSAAYHGGMNGSALNAPISGISSTSTGNGYWLIGKDGGVFTFGDAVFAGAN